MDSCINPETGSVAALEYLQGIGVNPAEQVKLIAASHWHDDHVRGLAETVAHCPSAGFVQSMALRNREFLRLVYAREFEPSAEASGVREMHDALEHLKRRGEEPVLAGPNQRIWEGESGASVTSLSPSNASVVRAMHSLARLLPEHLEPIRFVPDLDPNEAAVVLWISIGNVHILLGGDLETGSDNDSGWLTIVATGSPNKQRAIVYKVAHHGSGNADHPGIWSELLEREPLALVTPFSKGGVVLPTRDDRGRICKYTKRAYITSPPRFPLRRRRDPRVDKIIDQTVDVIHDVDGAIGHVRVRLSESHPGDALVERFGAAAALCN